MKWPVVAVLAFFAQSSAFAAEPPPSLTHFRCYICHSDQDALVGPAFADIAKSYQGRSDAVDSIARDIRTGIRTGGPWHMPPHPEVSQAEAREMARYIMSLKPMPPASAKPVNHPPTEPSQEKR